MKRFFKRPPAEKDDPSVSKEFSIGNSVASVGRFTYGFSLDAVHQWGEGANLRIGSFCSIAEGLTVMLGGNHRTDWATTFPFGHVFVEQLGGEHIVGHPKSNGDLEIGNDVWIGRNVTIMSGLRIGHGAVVASNATVTKSIGDYEIWGGNPAKKIKDRFEHDVIAALLALQWWDFTVDAIRRLAPLLSQMPNVEIINEIRKIADISLKQD